MNDALGRRLPPRRNPRGSGMNTGRRPSPMGGTRGPTNEQSLEFRITPLPSSQSGSPRGQKSRLGRGGYSRHRSQVAAGENFAADLVLDPKNTPKKFSGWAPAKCSPKSACAPRKHVSEKVGIVKKVGNFPRIWLCI